MDSNLLASDQQNKHQISTSAFSHNSLFVKSLYKHFLWDYLSFYLFKKFIGVEMLYNVVLVSAV